MTILSIIHRTKDLQLEISFLTEAVVGNIRNCLKHQNIDHLWWCCEHMFEGTAPVLVILCHSLMNISEKLQTCSHDLIFKNIYKVWNVYECMGRKLGLIVQMRGYMWPSKICV